MRFLCWRIQQTVASSYLDNKNRIDRKKRNTYKNKNINAVSFVKVVDTSKFKLLTIKCTRTNLREFCEFKLNMSKNVVYLKELFK